MSSRRNPTGGSIVLSGVNGGISPGQQAGISSGLELITGAHIGLKTWIGGGDGCIDPIKDD